MNLNHQTGTPEPAPGPADPAIDAAIVRALARAPEIHIPDSFAAAVTRRAIAQPPHRAPAWTSWGVRLGLGSSAILTLAMFALAPHAAPSFSNGTFDAELLLLCELAAIALFFGRLLPRD